MQATPTTKVDTSLCLPLNAPGATLAATGGKGLNLTKLAQAGFPVPGGLIVTTAGYDAFVTGAGLDGWMAGEVAAMDSSNPDALAALSQRIRARFRESAIPSALAETIRSAYASLGRPKVAVRSSATAEDLPDFSFAGQQDTFLNVLGDDALWDAVRECWSSLWTARAIGYRARNGIDQSAVSLAVVVQEMVQSEVSGVLFTANPLSGRRTETVIDATFGLGEALVAGLVQPDHYVTETASGRIIEKRLGAKATVIRGVAGGGTVTEAADAGGQQALSDDAIAAVTALGKRVADFYASPQDIEWGYADGRLYLLQSRAITSLFPLPNWGDTDDLHIFFSFAAVQGVMDPITPLGQDLIKLFLSGGALLFDRPAPGYKEQRVFFIAAERLWIDFSTVIRNRLGRKLFTTAVGAIEPGARDAVVAMLDDPRILARSGPPGPTTFRSIFTLLRKIGPNLLHALRRPEETQRQFRAMIEGFVVDTERSFAQAHTLAERLAAHQEFAQRLGPQLMTLFMPCMLAGYIPLNLLLRMADRLHKSDPSISQDTVLAITRGLPYNVTTEMDLALWQTAQAIRKDAASAQLFAETDGAALGAAWQEKRLPTAAQKATDDFMARYGMRGVAEIDFGRPRWRELPDQVMQTIRSYLTIEDENAAPDAVFRRGEVAAAAAIDQLAEAAQRAWGRGGVVRALARRVRALAGVRESPKFTAIRLMGISRAALLESGRELVTAGVIERADDLMFLHFDELQVLAMHAPGDWKRLVADRRRVWERDRGRRPLPRFLFSDGYAIYEGLTTDTNLGPGVLTGSAVSPGVAEGVVRVVFDPHGANLQHGEILVCPGTDPAWTPLFLAAGGLVTEVGGMMTHGSVVAREYGIPAVVVVDRATERLQTGQRVRIDGSSGRIEILG